MYSSIWCLLARTTASALFHPITVSPIKPPRQQCTGVAGWVGSSIGGEHLFECPRAPLRRFFFFFFSLCSNLAMGCNTFAKKATATHCLRSFLKCRLERRHLLKMFPEIHKPSQLPTSGNKAEVGPKSDFQSLILLRLEMISPNSCYPPREVSIFCPCSCKKKINCSACTLACFRIGRSKLQGEGL